MRVVPASRRRLPWRGYGAPGKSGGGPLCFQQPGCQHPAAATWRRLPEPYMKYCLRTKGEVASYHGAKLPLIRRYGHLVFPPLNAGYPVQSIGPTSDHSQNILNLVVYLARHAAGRIKSSIRTWSYRTFYTCLPRSASNDAMISSSSEVIEVCRNCRDSAVRERSRSSMFRSATCIDARRLAFSLASDSAKARYSETNRYSRMSNWKSRDSSIVNMGITLDGQLLAFNPLIHSVSTGSNRTPRTRYQAPETGRA